MIKKTHRASAQNFFSGEKPNSTRTNHFVVYYKHGDLAVRKIGATVGMKACKKSVARNKLKRKIIHAIKSLGILDYDIFISAQKNSAELDKEEIADEIKNAFNKIN